MADALVIMACYGLLAYLSNDAFPKSRNLEYWRREVMVGDDTALYLSRISLTTTQAL